MQADLPFSTPPTRRRRFGASVIVDGHSLGLLTETNQLTPAMRAHGITAADLSPVLTGRRCGRQFLCNGEVVIRRVLLMPAGRRHAQVRSGRLPK
ncbi:hypothetical protein [Rhodanobacter denitrificans]|uniref:Uncharacterized protein n=1 Tax=Rhodanobacter denitrificans TaxID=666685 RepID=M4NMY2_9GAMM|nr:hypothetical protein [Rhodanobacter denitrificans]AGG89041.1 hypothetical protein R2APBS1_1918 [Rhodanobacter denitrificans]UJJ53070.1 hypothetical protein LRK52_18360 [Rhodanobacter denitrificans]